MSTNQIIQNAEFEFPIDQEAEHKLYQRILLYDHERCGYIKVHYFEGRMEVIDFWEIRDQLKRIILGTNRCLADPGHFLESEQIHICWHTHPKEDYPEPSDTDFKFMKTYNLDYEVIAGEKAYLVIMKEGETFKTKYVEWEVM